MCALKPKLLLPLKVARFPEAPSDGGTYARNNGEWRRLGIPRITPALSDIANTSGDLVGSTADTGQTWFATGEGLDAPGKKPFYASDALGGYMRATDSNSGSANTYVYAATGAPCTRVAVLKRGVTATLALLNVEPSFSPGNMIHVNFSQATGTPEPLYWKEGGPVGLNGFAGIAVPFAYDYRLTNPESDPDKPRWYEIEVVGQHVICYVDGQFVGIASDPVIPQLVGDGFYVQLHEREDRVYEVHAWRGEDTPPLGEHATVTSLTKSRLAAAAGLHVGDESVTTYKPDSNFWVQSNAPTFRGAGGGTLNAKIQATGAGLGANLFVLNSDGVGIEIQGSASFNGIIKHQGGNRIEFPVNISRVDFPVAVKAMSVAHVVALTYGATVATDATAGDVFDLTLTGNATLSNPTNPIDGKTITWRILQDANGGHAVTLGNKFAIPTTITSPLPWEDTADTMSILSATYHSARDKWDIVQFHTEYA